MTGGLTLLTAPRAFRKLPQQVPDAGLSLRRREWKTFMACSKRS